MQVLIILPKGFPSESSIYNVNLTLGFYFREGEISFSLNREEFLRKEK